MTDKRQNLFIKCLPQIQFFFLGCILGWLWEVIYRWINGGMNQNLFEMLLGLRGFLHGPWVPIYGVGGVLMLEMREHFAQKPGSFFLGSMAVCGAMEFATSWFLEQFFHIRLWDYSGKFLNLNGRISLSGLLFFGMAGLVGVYFLEPAFQKGMRRFPIYNRKILYTILVTLFAVDVIISVAGRVL